jgi:hypothetical protein
MAEDAGRWAPSRTTRIGLWASLASAAIGILFAVFEVQGWKVPGPLALALIVFLLAVIAVAVLMISVEVARAIHRFFEYRATSASWVSSEAPGLLDYEADGIRAGNRFTKELYKLNDDTETLGKRLARHSKRMERSAGKSARKRQRLANRSAKAMNRSAEFIEKRLELLEALVKDVRRNTEGLIGAQDLETDGEIAAAAELSGTLKEGHQTTVETGESVAGYRDTVRDIERQNLARTVRLASHRLGDALDGMVKVLRRQESGSLHNAKALDQKIAKAQR